jgi:LacI family transcriptional regulator
VLYSDDVQGAYDLTRYLISLGHQDIWFFGDTDLPWYERCARGYQNAMESSGLKPRLSEIHSDGHQLGYMATRSVLSRNEPMTAIFAGSDQIARGVYEALRQAELEIPDDVSVAAFNDTEAALSDPPLTSVREYPEELGKHLADLVLRRTREPTRPPQQLTIPTRLIVRDSTKHRATPPQKVVEAAPLKSSGRKS